MWSRIDDIQQNDKGNINNEINVDGNEDKQTGERNLENTEKRKQKSRVKKSTDKKNGE